MQVDIITLFPHSIQAYLQESMMQRAQARGILELRITDLRPFGEGPHKKVDDRPYGGGPGMVLKVEPIMQALQAAVPRNDTKIIVLSPAGKQFTAKFAVSFSKKYEHLIFICGRYEGIDARLKKVVRDTFSITVEEISIGPYVLSGGELPALVVLEAIARHLPDFLGKQESLEERRQGVGIPMYTRPADLELAGHIYKVPKVLQSGDHGKIQDWREQHKK